ncbi:hypothetical protein HK098_005051 [Nowakowskiella sp. JEL0407]|nr:hypothetical protein HK098_005051 [Nowakowskiella sp. JEL0407]
MTLDNTLWYKAFCSSFPLLSHNLPYCIPPSEPEDYREKVKNLIKRSNSVYNQSQQITLQESSSTPTNSSNNETLLSNIIDKDLICSFLKKLYPHRKVWDMERRKKKEAIEFGFWIDTLIPDHSYFKVMNFHNDSRSPTDKKISIIGISVLHGFSDPSPQNASTSEPTSSSTSPTSQPAKHDNLNTILFINIDTRELLHHAQFPNNEYDSLKLRHVESRRNLFVMVKEDRSEGWWQRLQFYRIDANREFLDNLFLIDDFAGDDGEYTFDTDSTVQTMKEKRKFRAEKNVRHTRKRSNINASEKVEISFRLKQGMPYGESSPTTRPESPSSLSGLNAAAFKRDLEDMYTPELFVLVTSIAPYPTGNKNLAFPSETRSLILSIGETGAQIEVFCHINSAVIQTKQFSFTNIGNTLSLTTTDEDHPTDANNTDESTTHGKSRSKFTNILAKCTKRTLDFLENLTFLSIDINEDMVVTSHDYNVCCIWDFWTGELQNIYRSIPTSGPSPLIGSSIEPVPYFDGEKLMLPLENEIDDEHGIDSWVCAAQLCTPRHLVVISELQVDDGVAAVSAQQQQPLLDAVDQEPGVQDPPAQVEQVTNGVDHNDSDSGSDSESESEDEDGRESAGSNIFFAIWNIESGTLIRSRNVLTQTVSSCRVISFESWNNLIFYTVAPESVVVSANGLGYLGVWDWERDVQVAWIDLGKVTNTRIGAGGNSDENGEQLDGWFDKHQYGVNCLIRTFNNQIMVLNDGGVVHVFNL